MQIQTVPAGRVIDWYKQGWNIFTSNIASWVLIALIFAAIALGLSLIPFLGAIVLYLLMPALQGGMLHAAREASRGGNVKIEDLFVVLKDGEKRMNMFALGGLMLAAVFVAMIISVPFIGGGMISSMEQMPAAGEMPIMPTLSLGGLLFAMIIGILIAMLFFYAPALVWFQGMGTIDAIKASFSACLKNLLPFMISRQNISHSRHRFSACLKNLLPFILFVLIYALLALLGSIPLGLGLLVVLPVAAGAVYASYKDVFA